MTGGQSQTGPAGKGAEAARGPPRRSESGVSSQPQPAVKVVGFHVEGLPHSPAPLHGTLLADAAHTHSGSPNPVIIPPSFAQADAAGGAKRSSGEAAPLTRHLTLPAGTLPPGSLTVTHLKEHPVPAMGHPEARQGSGQQPEPLPGKLHPSISLPSGVSRDNLDLDTIARAAAGTSSVMQPGAAPTSPMRRAQGQGGKGQAGSTSMPSTPKPPGSHAVSPGVGPHTSAPTTPMAAAGPMGALASVAAAAAQALGAPFGTRRSRSASPELLDLQPGVSLAPTLAPQQQAGTPSLAPLVTDARSSISAGTSGAATPHATPTLQHSPSLSRTSANIGRAAVESADTMSQQLPPKTVSASFSQSTLLEAGPQLSARASQQHVSPFAAGSEHPWSPTHQEQERQNGAAVQADGHQPSAHQQPTEVVQTSGNSRQLQAPGKARRSASGATHRSSGEAELRAQAELEGQQRRQSSAAEPPAAAASSSDAEGGEPPADSPAQGGGHATGGPARERRHPRSPEQDRLLQQRAWSSESAGLTRSTDMFSHLRQFKRVTADSVTARTSVARAAHPAIFELGMRYADGRVRGANARCVTMMDALKQLIQDYHTPPGKSLPRDLLAQLNANVAFLVECRPLAVSCSNALKFVKTQIGRVGKSVPEADAKAQLLQGIDSFLHEKINFADKLLVENATAKVYDGDVILTFGHSSTVLSVLLAAHQAGKRFRVIVVDARPELEGQQLLQQLLQAGLACTYTHLNALYYIMAEASKVMLGAAAVLSNGTVVSRAGTAAVGMMAAQAGKPVIICCETYKFHERVQLDSITSNELGDPEAIMPAPEREGSKRGAGQQRWEQQPNLGLLNLVYDAMPAEFVTVIMTEFGAIPPTSVLVILRESHEQMP